MRILLIDADRQRSYAMERSLKQVRYTVDAVYDAQNGFHYAVSDLYDLIILDGTLDVLDGTSLLSRIRQDGLMTPIVRFGQKTQDHDNVGGVYWISLPLDLAKLMDTIRSIRLPANQSGHTFLDITLKENTLIGPNGSVVLSDREQRLLCLLIDNQERHTTNSDIRDALLQGDKLMSDNNIRVYVSKLRRLLTSIASTATITTTRNVGYRLVDGM